MSVCVPCGHNSNYSMQLPEVDTTNMLARPIAGYTPALYRFKDEQTSTTLFEDTDLDRLIARVTQFRFENNFPAIPYLKEVILDFTMRSDDAHLPYTTFYQTSEPVHISAKQFLYGALAYAKAKTYLSEKELFVEKEVAEERALTCLNCPRHIPQINGKSADHPNLVQSRFAQLAKGRTTPYDNALQVCGVCTCLCKAKIHFTLDFINSASTPQLRQEFKQHYVGLNGKDHVCWISGEKTK